MRYRRRRRRRFSSRRRMRRGVKRLRVGYRF